MKRFIFTLAVILLAVPQALAGGPSAKLGRGIHNIAFGWFEIVHGMAELSDEHGVMIGIPGGLLQGAAFGLGRTLAGVCEVLTFPFPNGPKGYVPVVYPESVFEGR